MAHTITAWMGVIGLLIASLVQIPKFRKWVIGIASSILLLVVGIDRLHHKK